MINSTVSILIAALNEEEGIGPTIKEIQQTLKEPYIIIIDGKSVDKTVEIAKNLGANVLLQEGKGKGDALSQGIKKLSKENRFVVITDADFTYPAEYILKMVEIIDHNPNVGMVIGNRFADENGISKSMKKSFYLGNKLLAFAHSTLNGVRLNDPLSGLRVIRTDLLKEWEPKSKGFDIEAEMNNAVCAQGFEIVEIPISYRDRLGVKKLKLRDGFSILKRIMFSYFNKHLRFFM